MPRRPRMRTIPTLPAAVLEAYLDIATKPGPIGGGDVLVFLPGEREIRDVADLLERELSKVEVLALFSRLSWEQQSKIFKRGPQQRIVLATNVAETSITVPGIRAVIDSGLARISRYSPRNRLQRLPIEPVSRASAEQRKGRCGRIGAGLCVRLYSQEDFEARPEFTEPEVLRTNLAALLLRLAADGLGEAETFPFIDPPESRALADGYRLLQELEALDDERRITRRGRAMARLPLDPRLARALLESQRFRAESELLAIVAGLSVPDVARTSVRRPRRSRRGRSGGGLRRSTFGVLGAGEAVAQPTARRAQGPRRELQALVQGAPASRCCASRSGTMSMARSPIGRRSWASCRSAQAASYAAVHRSLLAGFCTMVGCAGRRASTSARAACAFISFPARPCGGASPGG